MRRLHRIRRGAALPIVLLLVALNVTVIVALLIYASTELQASRNAVHTESARVLAQSGIELAASLVAANSTNNAFVSYQRVTNVAGVWRLETKIANVVAPDPSRPWKTTATNPAVLHTGFASGSSGVDLNFAVDGDASAGFIAPRGNATGWTNLSADMFRMNWLYIYRGDTNNPQNLIGRIAYWVDDESSKLNINYSGSSEVYGSGFDNSLPLPVFLRGPRPGVAANTNSHGYFNGRTWPLDMELGGVAGLSIPNVQDAISWRGRPDRTGFRPFPSVLGLRIGTLSGSAGVAVTNLVQQSSLGFTATAFSSEAERSYRSGRRRYDLMNFYSGSPQTNITALRSAITAEYPDFADKYDLDAFAGAAYSMVQIPGANANTNSPQHPASTFGSQRIYVRGLPVVNEISIQAVAREAGGTNTVELRTAVEVATLGDAQRLPSGWNQNGHWGFAVEQSTNYVARVTLRNTEDAGGAVYLGGWQPPSPVTLTNAAVWFTKRNPQGDGSGRFGPRSPDLAGAFGVLTATNTFSVGGPLGPWTFPNQMDVELAYNGKVYQTFGVTVPATPGGSFSPTAGATNVVYALVGQPLRSSGVRGDPRLALFEANATADLTAGFPANYIHPLASTNALNPNWDVNDASGAERPDLMRDTLSFGVDYGLPGYSGTLDYGFGWTMAGLGWLGEVPVVSPSAGGTQLGWSTPRFWGDGRETPNTPPDWLLMDVVHLAMYPADAAGNFVSRGRVNVNSAKSFFQPVAGSINKADSIMDSVLIGAGTKDFRTEIYGAPALKSLDGRQTFRTNVLHRIQEMVSARTSADRPYTTHFEFLAELAATNVTGTATADWMAPEPPGSHTATNTTDRRIEGLVRSLNQKFTTRGNQFSIFSLAQALQVTPSGTTNVVGESFLQAVYERAPEYQEATGAITNSPTGAPPMRQLFLRELRY